MAERIVIELPAEEEARDLLRALAVRGLPGRVLRAGRRPGVVLDCARESTALLLGDLLPAVEAWRLDRGLAAPRIDVGGRPYRTGSRSEARRCLNDASSAPPRVPAQAA